MRSEEEEEEKLHGFLFLIHKTLTKGGSLVFPLPFFFVDLLSTTCREGRAIFPFFACGERSLYEARPSVEAGPF